MPRLMKERMPRGKALGKMSTCRGDSFIRGIMEGMQSALEEINIEKWC